MDKILNSLELYLDDKKATQKEIDRFILFVKRLKSSRRVRFIYRGDSNIIKQYNTDSSNLLSLAIKIFCLGDKGRYFFQNKLVGINSVFSLIWDKFHNKVCKLNFALDSTMECMSDFLNKNPMFNNYFSDELSQTVLINCINKSILEKLSNMLL